MHSTIAVVCARMFTRSLSDEDDLSIYLECAQGPMVHEVFAVACIVKQFRHTFNDWTRKTIARELVRQVCQHIETHIHSGRVNAAKVCNRVQKHTKNVMSRPGEFMRDDLNRYRCNWMCHQIYLAISRSRCGYSMIWEMYRCLIWNQIGIDGAADDVCRAICYKVIV